MVQEIILIKIIAGTDKNYQGDVVLHQVILLGI
jgi:hypothetical protein